MIVPLLPVRGEAGLGQTVVVIGDIPAVHVLVKLACLGYEHGRKGTQDFT